MKHKKALQQGQILLITIMLLATAITVVLTTAFIGQTDTKITKLEADQQKALAAAEAGVEAALKKNVGDSVDISGLGLGSTGTANVSSFGADQRFVTPSAINANSEYTYYVSDYDTATGVFTSPWNNSLKIYYGSSGVSDCSADIALDISIIYQPASSAIVKKLVAIDSTSGFPDIAAGPAGSAGQDFGGTTTDFACRTNPVDLSAYSNAKVLIIRVLKQNTQLGFESTGGTPLKAQGKLVTSEAKTSAGASKKVQLFQSYPQIPAEFFVTSF